MVLIVLLSVALITGVVLIIYQSMKLREMKNQLAQLTTRNQELNSVIHSGELKALRYKLNPHLFKNALNSIQSHAYQTYYSMDKLSGVLDYILYESDQPMVSLSEEMNFALNFIEINRLKVSPLFDLRVRNTIAEEETEGLKVLPLVTVDLIENAFKHTNFQKPDSFISIHFHLNKGVFELHVSNRVSEKPPLKKKNSGVGLRNLEERLNIAFEQRYHLSTFTEDDVFHAKLQLKLDGIAL